MTEMPLGPPGECLAAHMQEASQRWNPFWFYGQVRRGGPWDFRLQEELYRLFGNFHYAAVGIAYGFPAWALRRGAGWEHWWSGRSDATWGRPWTHVPYGDDPEDQRWIEAGMTYARERGYRHGIGGRIVWRAVDIVIGAGGLLVLAPLLALLALLTLLDSGRPVFDGSWRMGRYGRPFRCWKIRTLRGDHADVLRRHLAEDAAARAEWLAHAKLRRDPRVTRLGRLLRRLSLDDIGPQCWNILVGEMALFGPRPFLLSERPRLGRHQETILAVTPGWVSYYGAYGRSRLTVAQRVRLEARFARRMHLVGVKCHALIGTVWNCVTGAGAA